MRLNRRRVATLITVLCLTSWANLSARLDSGRAARHAVGPAGRRVFSLSGSTWVRGPVALGDLDGDGTDDIVVGGSDGKVYAYKGDGTKLWEYDTGDAAIEGKAAIGDVNGDDCKEVVIGVGSTFTPSEPGAVWAFTHNGTPLWSYPSGDFNSDGIPDGVYSSPALANVDGNDNGNLEIIYGSWDGHIRVLNDDGTLLWERFVRDTVWSSPAIGDIDRDGRLEIAIGVDSHKEGPPYNTEDGGILYVLNGEDGSVLFRKQIDEVIWSSPALGDLNGDGWLDIVVGTGDCWENPACAPYGRTHPTAKALYAWDHTGSPLPGWPIALSDFALASPAVGDLDADGDLEVVVNTSDAYVHAFHANGTPITGWPALVTTPAGPGSVVHYATGASPILADLTGDGNLEVILPSNWEIVVWDRMGNQLTRTQFPPLPEQWTLDTSYAVASTPAVGDVDGDGKMELVVGGASSNGNPGAIYVWDFDGVPRSARAPWSSFRRDPLNHARYWLPRLSVTPSSLLVFYEYGSGSFPTAHLWIANGGDGQMHWQVELCPPEATVSPSSGMVADSPQAVVVTVAATGYQPGTYSLGDIVISGTGQGESALGSPKTVSLTLYVGEIHRSLLPLILYEH